MTTLSPFLSPRRKSAGLRVVQRILTHRSNTIPTKAPMYLLDQSLSIGNITKRGVVFRTTPGPVGHWIRRGSVLGRLWRRQRRAVRPIRLLLRQTSFIRSPTIIWLISRTVNGDRYVTGFRPGRGDHFQGSLKPLTI